MAKQDLRRTLLSRRLSANGPMAPADDDFRSARPLLFDLLTRPLRLKDRVLDPIKLTVQVGDGDWILTLVDSVLCQTLTLRAGTVNAGLEALNLVLGSEEQRWSVWRKGSLKALREVAQPSKKKLDNGQAGS